MTGTTAVLTLRTLNRTFLERQLLLRRVGLPARDVVERLVAVQAQEADPPYVGLWSRMTDFAPEDLERLLHDRVVVRGALLRRTQHLALGDDYLAIRPLLERAMRGTARTGIQDELEGLEPADIAAAAREILRGRVLPRPELGRLLAERFPGRRPAMLARVAHYMLPLVHPLPGGRWGHRGRIPCALAEDWLGRPLDPETPAAPMIRRYLAGFGPASVRDMQAWSGVTRLKDVVAGMDLTEYRDEHGRVLYDLPGAALADADAPAPVRFIPEFDNLVLGHADRTRIVSDADRGRVISGAIVRSTLLVDGFVHGLWRMDRSRLVVSPFRPLPDPDAVLAEAGRLAGFITGGAGDVVLEPPS